MLPSCIVNMLATLILYIEASPKQAQRILELGRKPIIIGGCGRSGTTLLLSILSCHPNILAIGKETWALCPDGYTPDGDYKKTPKLDVPFGLWRIYRNLIDQQISHNFKRWCEKTPRNVIYFERILRHFGERVRIIHMVRDGRDVVTSKHPRKPYQFWITPHRWVQDVSAGRKVENQPQVLTIRYEDLLLDYEKTVRLICEFIEEEFVSTFLSYPESATVRSGRAWFIPAREIHTLSIGRWKDPRYAQRIDSLLSEPMAMDLLLYYGYDIA